VIFVDSAANIPKSRLFIPTMFMFGLELLGPARSVVSNRRDSWEIEGQIDIYRYFLVYDYGGEIITYDQETYNYRSDGTYWRLGVDINMIPRDEFGSLLYLGFRYAESSYSDEMRGTVFDNQWGYTSFWDVNGHLNARWYEIVLGMRAKVWRELYMGYTLRMKTSLEVSEDPQEFETYWVPGYGVASESPFWGLSYYVAWRFNFGQKYMVPPKE